jgi:hypothetical protein
MTAGIAAPPSTPRAVPIALVVWLVAAIAIGASGLLASLPFPGAQLVILALVTISISAVSARGPVRAWVDGLSWRALVGFHGIRLIGFLFVWLGARGALSPLFATRAGWGDAVVAVVALGLVAFAVAPTQAKWAYNAWNLFGLLDLIVAVSTATWVVQQGLVPGVELLLRLPLALVPLFFVPLLAASHVALFRRINAH